MNSVFISRIESKIVKSLFATDIQFYFERRMSGYLEIRLISVCNKSNNSAKNWYLRYIIRYNNKIKTKIR